MRSQALLIVLLGLLNGCDNGGDGAPAAQGPTIETIIEEAGRLKVDMIVVGSHGHGAMYQLLVGSVSEGVLHRATCPVLVVPARKRT